MNVSAQHDQILIKFKSGATALDIQSLMNEISAQPLDFSGLSGVHKWQLPSQYPITTMFGTTLYSPLDILELTVGKAIVQGVDLNYQGGPNPYGTSFYGNYFNLPDYNPLYDCSAYPGHILASGLGDKHVRIAIIDTGIDDENMPDLFGSRIASSYDFIEDKPSSVIDENGHGTQVAGIITGMAYVSDLYNVDLLELKALDGSGSGDLYDIIEAIEYAVENGANIINCSFGYSPLNGDHYSNLFHQVLEEASSHGILIIAASGNDNNDLDNIKYYPGSYTDIPNLIKVGASKCDGSTTSFGSFGYQSVELAGPGVHILCPSINGRWLYKEGTSFAAPIVTGVAMQFASTMSSFNAGAIKNALIQQAIPSPSFSGLTQSGAIVNIVNPNLNDDFNTKTVLSTAIQDLEAPQFSVFPNPFDGGFTAEISFDRLEEGTINLVLRDITNRPVWKGVQELAGGKAAFNFQDGGRLPAGFYTLEYHSRNQSGRSQLIKQ